MMTGALAEDSVKVGIVLPLTGDQAKFGEVEKLSFDLALEEINAAGGINGKKLELLIEDDTGRPEVGRSVVEKLINKDKVVLIGGGYSSSVTYAVAGVCQQNRIPFVVNTGSADNITTSGWDYIFRINPPASEYSMAVENLLTEVVKPKTIVILYENSLFGTTSAKAFEDSCKKLGFKVLMKEGYEHGGIDYKPVLIRVKQANPDVVYMVSYVMDAALLMKQAKELRLTPKIFIGAAPDSRSRNSFKMPGLLPKKSSRRRSGIRFFRIRAPWTITTNSWRNSTRTPNITVPRHMPAAM